MIMQRRLLIGGIAILAFLIAGYFALDESTIEYGTIQQARETGKVMQITGQWVKEQGYRYVASVDQFYFVLRDDQGDEIPVVYQGAKPNNFELSNSIVVRGRILGDTLRATAILTKCPSKYEGTQQTM